VGLARWRAHSGLVGYWLATLVVRHWVLDYLTHAPDMPLWPGASPHLGLGLWNSVAGTLVIEGLLWVDGIALYLRGRRAVRWIGPVAFGSFVIVNTAMWAAGFWSPPPPDSRSLAWFSLIGWVVVPWAALADRYFTRRAHGESHGQRSGL